MIWEAMMRQYDEKRSHRRMSLDCALSYGVQGESRVNSGLCINLSATGVMFKSQRPLNIGNQIVINITPQKTVVPPLNAAAEVLRVVEGNEKDTWWVAARITQIN